MASEVTVACVFSPLGGAGYTRDHVERLRRMVDRHLSVPHRFVCLTDARDYAYDIEAGPFERGWWCKVRAFEHLTGPTIYLDIDTVITGPIDWLHVPGRPFAMWWYDRKAGGIDHWCSAFMAWDGDFSHISHEFARNPRAAMSANKGGLKGDQAFIAATAGVEIADIALGRRDLIDHLSDRPPPPLVYFSGSKKPWTNADHPVVREHWQ